MTILISMKVMLLLILSSNSSFFLLSSLKRFVSRQNRCLFSEWPSRCSGGEFFFLFFLFIETPMYFKEENCPYSSVGSASRMVKHLLRGVVTSRRRRVRNLGEKTA